MKRNLVFKLTGEAGVRLLSTVFVLMLARILGVAEFGQYATAFAFVTLFSLLSDLGLNAIVTREVARRLADRPAVIAAANAIKLIASVGTWVVIHLVARRFTRLEAVPPDLIDVMAVVGISNSMTDYFAALLSGKEEMGWEAVLKITCRCISLGSALIVLFWTHSLFPTMVTAATASIVSLAVASGFIRARFGWFAVRADWTTMKRLLIQSIPVFGSVVFWVLYDNQNILLLKYFRESDTAIGHFAAASKIIDVLKVLPFLLVGAFYPRLSRLSDLDQLVFQTRRLIKLALLSAGAIVIVLGLLSPQLIVLLYGPKFEPAAHFLRIMLGAYFFIAFNQILLNVFLVRDHERQLLAGAVYACVVNILIACFLIPRFGAAGACYSLLASQTLYLLFQARLVRHLMPDLFRTLEGPIL
jgi:O-antigen/teichoic acid export membrane protein